MKLTHVAIWIKRLELPDNNALKSALHGLRVPLNVNLQRDKNI